MKKSKFIAIFASVFAVGMLLAPPGLTVRANDLVISGDASGALTVVSADTNLFDLSGAYPGDKIFSSLTVRNDDNVNAGFTLSMYVENTYASDYNLGEVTQLLISEGSRVIYDGMLADADGVLSKASPVVLGDVPRGELRSYDFTLTVDGEKADDRYQSQQAEFTVTLIVNSFGRPPAPPTPAPSGSPTRVPREREPSTVRRISTPEEIQPEPETISIEEPDVPLSDLPALEAPQEDFVVLEDEEIPLAAMPTTGEPGLIGFIVAGLATAACGTWMVYKARRER